MNSILKSKYLYSAYTQVSGLENSYIKYNASITFSLNNELNTSIYADILMQSSNVNYTDLVFWNTNTLGKNEIALSKNLADKYHLKVGDKIYSRHVVDGTIFEYTIGCLLPKVASTRIIHGNTFTDGIIIMGYDERYENNISHVYVLYTDENVNTLFTETAGALESILYREDELVSVGKGLLPFIILYLVTSFLIVVGYITITMKDISHNFKRQAILGYEKRKLDCAYNKVVFVNGIYMIIFVLVITVFGSLLFGLGLVEVMLLVMTSCLELLLLFFLTIRSRRQLWRG
jgi:hypothetical protein